MRIKNNLFAVGKLHPVVKRLLLIRLLRSIGQGAMVVDLTLYLKDLHWNAAEIGGVTSAAGLFGAALILVVGILSDRMGRRPFLLSYEALTLIAAFTACFTSKTLPLVLIIVISGFGRGQSGAAGPFSPAEQAWLARHVEHSSRGTVFSLNNAMGFLGMALGSATGGIPALIASALPIQSYRPIFILVGVVSFSCILILLNMKEKRIDVKDISKNDSPGNHCTTARDVLKPMNEILIRRQENIAMLKLGLVNTLNGLAIGLTGPMMAYWFSIRYGASTAEIGVTLSIGFLMTGIFSILNGFLANRIGMVKSVTWMRVIGSGMMLILPWMPNFMSASVFYILRNAINRGTQGNRSALSASLTRDKRRGLATSINALSMRLPSSIGPTLSGYMFDAGELALPLILTATLQFINAGIYQWIFGKYDKKEQVCSEQG